MTHSNDAGMLSFKLSIHDINKQGKINFRDYSSWRSLPPTRDNPILIRAFIYQCRDLPAADSNGTSDPFVKAWDASGQVKKTSVIEDNNNPLFYETLELEYEVRDADQVETFPPFLLDVFDEDKELLDSSDDYLARAVIHPKDLGDALIL